MSNLTKADNAFFLYLFLLEHLFQTLSAPAHMSVGHISEAEMASSAEKRWNKNGCSKMV